MGQGKNRVIVLKQGTDGSLMSFFNALTCSAINFTQITIPMVKMKVGFSNCCIF